MLTINAKTAPLVRDLTRTARDQVPFANALAVNKVARRVIDGESQAISETFNNPRAFTKSAFTQSGAFGGMYAKKKLPVAIIVAKPIQAGYLAPTEQPKDPQKEWQGAQHIRTPVNIKTNASGDIPRNALTKLWNRPDVFFGTVRGILGLWQRPNRGTRRGGSYGTKGKHYKNAGFATTLKLLVAYTRPVTVKPDLDFAGRAQAIVDSFWPVDFNAALGEALESAKK